MEQKEEKHFAAVRLASPQERQKEGCMKLSL